MSSWERMGKRPIREEEDEHWIRNGYRSYGETQYWEDYDHNQGGYYGHDNQRNRWSREEEQEEEDVSLKELLKQFIQVQNTKDEELELSMKVFNNQIEQNLRNNQENIQDLERRIEQMNEWVEWVENQPTGQESSYIQSDPELSNDEDDQGLEFQQNQWSIQEEEDKSWRERMNKRVENQPMVQIEITIHFDSDLSEDEDDQGLRYQAPYIIDSNVNVTGTQSGFSYGDEEEQNGKEKKIFFADLGFSARHWAPVRRTKGSDSKDFGEKLDATHSSVPVRSIDPVQPRNDLEVKLEVENHVGDEPMVHNEDETPKSTPILPTREYEPRKEDSLDMELQELLGTETGEVDNMINVDITLEEFEMMFDLSVYPIVTNDKGEKKLKPKMKDEEETVEASDDNQNSKGIPNELVELLCFLTCLEKKIFLQGRKDEEYEPLNFDNFIHGNPIGLDTEKVKLGGECVYSYKWKDVSIMRETREWHDAWTKTRMKLNVSNRETLFDDLISRRTSQAIDS